jgi:kynurenine formamidase
VKVDLTLKVSASKVQEITSLQAITAFGHMGTHVDVMGKEFPLDNVSRRGRLIVVTRVAGRDIEPEDFAGVEFESRDVALIYTGFIDRVPYGTPEYFTMHPELSWEAVQYLLDRNVSLIGIDGTGLRRGDDHKKVDRLCAENNVFVVENLVNLKTLAGLPRDTTITISTLAVNIEGLTGLPCRVVAEF